MPILAAATTPAQLDSVSDAVREWWFEPRAVAELPGAELQIPLSIATGLAELAPMRWLRIRRVKAHRVNASPQIPAYDIDRLLYQPAKSQIEIRTGIPLVFEVDVEGLDVDVVEPSPT